MGNDENTIKVAAAGRRAGPGRRKAYCDDMARQFQEVWDALDISYDDFIQTSERAAPRSAAGSSSRRCTTTGYIYKRRTTRAGTARAARSSRPRRRSTRPAASARTTRRRSMRSSEPCYFFAPVRVPGPAAAVLRGEPRFIQPESRRNEIVSLVEGGAAGRQHHAARASTWGIRVPFDPEFTIYVWFDALLNYITGIGYGDRRGAVPRSAGRPTSTSSARTSPGSTAPSGRRC